MESKILSNFVLFLGSDFSLSVALSLLLSFSVADERGTKRPVFPSRLAAGGYLNHERNKQRPNDVMTMGLGNLNCVVSTSIKAALLYEIIRLTW